MAKWGELTKGHGMIVMEIGMTQQTTFANDGKLNACKLEIESHRIHGRNRLEKFLHGTKKCNTVAYVFSLDFIEQYIDELGIQELNIILGKEFSVSKVKSLDPRFIEKLAEWRNQGILNVRIPKKGIFHEKLFFCWDENNNWFMDLNGSANPTKSGSGGSGQSNRITTIKISGDYDSHSHYLKCMEEWDWYLENSTPFLESLFDMLPPNKEEWNEVIVRFLESDGDLDIESASEIRVITQNLGKGLLESSIEGESAYTMDIEGYREASVTVAREKLNKLGLDIDIVGNKLTAPIMGIDFLSPVKESAPFMSISKGKIWVRLDGKTIPRTADELDKVEINKALENLEKYVNSLDNAHRGDIRAKMALSEFLLILCSAPFDHLFMKQRRQLLPRLREGPRMTSYYGTAGNGKSYSVRYGLKMLTGVDIDPLGTNHFTKKGVLEAASCGSIFPLIFDDLQKQRIRQWEEWGKYYWDSGYTFGSPYPQLILTSNDRFDSGGALGRRAREISMHANFSSNEVNSFVVELLLKENTDFFLYFSKLMLDDLLSANPSYFHEDELGLSRIVVTELYNIANRKIPKWWAKKPVEMIHDDHAYQWLDMINKGICEAKIHGDEIILEFGVNWSTHDVKDLSRLIPNTVAAEHGGSKVRIRNPNEFIEWVNSVRQIYPLKIRWKVKRLLKSKF